MPRKSLFSILIITALIALLSSTGWAQSKPADPEDKAAIVNGVIITKTEFNKALNNAKQRLLSKENFPNKSQMAEIRKGILETLVNRELLFQESQKKGITADKSEINEQWTKMQAKFPSQEKFQESFGQTGLSEDAIKLQITRGLTVQKFVDTQLTSNLAVSEEEIKQHYERTKDSYKQPEQIQVSHILIKSGPDDTDEQKAAARKKMEEIQQRLKAGDDFAALAREFSQCPSAAFGGNLGYVRRGQMEKPVESAAFTLTTNELSDIIQSIFGYHLIKVVDKKPEVVPKYEDVKEDIKKQLKQRKTQQQVNQYVNALKKTAKIELFIK